MNSGLTSRPGWIAADWPGIQLSPASSEINRTPDGLDAVGEPLDGCNSVDLRRRQPAKQQRDQVHGR